MVSVKRQCQKNAQYSLRECAEVVGIPSSIIVDQLKNTIRRVLQYIGANITDKKIQSCHWLNINTESIIVKFLKRKDCDQLMRVEGELKKLKQPTWICLKGQNSTLIKACVPAIEVCGTSSRIVEQAQIISFGSVRIKLRENESYNIIFHNDD